MERYIQYSLMQQIFHKGRQMAGKFLGYTVASINLDALVRELPDGRFGWKFWRRRTRGRYIRAILESWDVLRAADIDTPIRLSHFIGQGLVETGYLNYDSEALSYSRANIIKYFRQHYKDQSDLLNSHVHNPEAFANHVYGNRMGNNEPSDGYKYRGRGFIQLTGRDNYRLISQNSNLPLEADPDLIRRDLKASIKAATVFWRLNGLNRWADENDTRAVSRAVNRGNPSSQKAANHEPDRILWTSKTFGLFNNPGSVLIDPTAPLKLGDKGERVVELQLDLLALGVDEIGLADGHFGKKTHLGVLVAQLELGLTVDGIAGPITIDAINERLLDPRTKPAALNLSGS